MFMSGLRTLDPIVLIVVINSTQAPESVYGQLGAQTFLDRIGFI